MCSRLDNRPYYSYLLRIWSSGTDRARVSYSLEDAHTGARRGFGSLDELFAFLDKEMVTARQEPPEGSAIDDECKP
jgi:hypothetical protein